MTQTHPESSQPGDLPGVPRQDEQDLLFQAYLEGELTAQERRAFEARLDQDDALRRRFEVFAEVVAGLGELPFVFAPDDFADKVESRIRRRSNGRLFSERGLATSRVPYEVIALVMMVVMAAAYFMMEAPRDGGLSPSAPPSRASQPEP